MQVVFIPCSIYGTIVAILLFHELGHFLTAYALRQQITSMELGTGPLVCSVVWRGIPIRIRAFLHSGYVDTVARSSWRSLAISAAGPAATFLSAVGAYITFGENFFTYTSIVVGLYNLIPFKFAGGETDGYQILSSLKKIIVPT